MSLARWFLGVSPGTAQSIQGNAATFAAAGTTQTDATDMLVSICHVTSGTGGVQLADKTIPGDSQIVFNESGSAITVYPPSGSTINQLSTNTGMVLANNTACRFDTFSATQIIAFLSA